MPHIVCTNDNIDHVHTKACELPQTYAGEQKQFEKCKADGTAPYIRAPWECNTTEDLAGLAVREPFKLPTYDVASPLGRAAATAREEGLDPLARNDVMRVISETPYRSEDIVFALIDRFLHPWYPAMQVAKDWGIEYRRLRVECNKVRVRVGNLHASDN